MDLFLDAINNIIELDAKFLDVILLSLFVSITATLISTLISVVVAGYIVTNKFLGKKIFIIIINTFMSLPPVAIGLILYIIFSNSGFLGFLNILYTPALMIIAQSIIVIPIILSLYIRSLEDKYFFLQEYLQSLNISNNKIRNTLIYETRYELLIFVITGLSRALSEVGAVIIVGGNIANYTRVMTTSIVLETSRGELSLALSIGIMLIVIALLINLFLSFAKNRVI